MSRKTQRIADIIDTVSSKIEKEFGAIHTLDDPDVYCNVRDWISTQCLPLDLILGKGGIPVGRLTEIFGGESSGKTTLLLHLLAETQRRGGIAVMLDTENAMDVDRAKLIGIDTSTLIYDAPDSIEQTLTKAEAIINAIREREKDTLVVIGWDSVAGTPTETELTGDFGKVEVASAARIISKGLRKLTQGIAEHRVALVFVNQIRDKIGVQWGTKYSTYGGRAIKFHASVRVKLTQVGRMKEKGVVVGIEVEADVVKNKVRSPFGRTRFPMRFTTGIDGQLSLLDMAVEFKVVKKAGAWYSIKNRKFHRSDFPAMLEKYPKLEEVIRRKAIEESYK